MPQGLPLNFTPPDVPATLTHHNITLQEWYATHPRLTNLCVGGLIFRLNTLTQRPQILLIKRAATDFFPNVWEIPGGSVEGTDSTVLDAAIREIWEETGLLIKEFKSQVWDARVGEKVMGKDGNEVVVGEKPGAGEVEFLGGRGETWCKLHFVVDVGEVKEGQVVLDPQEHQDWGWFEKEQIVGVEGKGLMDFISEQAVSIVERGFEDFEKQVCSTEV
ncbi:NUDIX hydrolase domain-like protein [Rhexocercosporidium sp. MPI-PUGE-AT-0058]|nr:NUDIX hydrolase domain-like protein [Rhexocercosporidium sp. MPI-PUGE-AT-0058]